MFKEVLTVLAGTIVFGDQLAVSNIWGVLVTLGGIGWYNWIKIQKMKEEYRGNKDLGDMGYEMVDRERERDTERDDLEVGFATEHEEQIDGVHLKP
jgi:solute carrier family 35 protein C2